MQGSVTFATLEFAGFKFSSHAHTGREYLHHIEQNILKEKHQLSCLKYLVICEEKYKFTPDDFKAATRALSCESILCINMSSNWGAKGQISTGIFMAGGS
jgi:hypothetical protein